MQPLFTILRDLYKDSQKVSLNPGRKVVRQRLSRVTCVSSMDTLFAAVRRICIVSTINYVSLQVLIIEELVLGYETSLRECQQFSHGKTHSF